MTLSWKKIAALAILSGLLATEAHAQANRLRGQIVDALEPQAETELDAGRVKKALETILKTYPPSLTQVLQLDPTLLTNSAYLAPYPSLAGFLKEHPSIAHNPAYFLGLHPSVKPPAPKAAVTYVYRDSGADHVGAYVVIFALMAIVGWLIRAVILHQRWLKTSRAQSETQSKILERFTSNEDLLNFIQTPAGRSFLESSAAPAQPATVAAPIQQILWSVQIGLVLFTAGAGLQVAGLYEVLSILMMAVGLGFVFSAISSWILSKKLGLLGASDVNSQTPPS
jgi:hypothetical protein